jgi:hypothetical protein
MSDAEREAHDEKWSNDNDGQHYGWYPALPYNAAFPDMLHMNLNQFNSATEEAFHSHLLDEAYTSPVLKRLAASVRDEVNNRLKAHAEQGGAGVLLTFGTPGKLHVANGPKMKAVLRHPKLLMELCELMRPLWAAAEAADEPAVRKRPLSKEEHEEEHEKAAAQATAAEMTAAAGQPAGPARAAGGKAPRKGQAAKKAAKANSMSNLRRGKQRAPVLPSCAEEQQQQDQSDAPMDADTGGTENDDDNADADATPEETAAFCENLDKRNASMADSLVKYEERVAWMFITMQEHFIFTRQHQHNSSDIDAAYRKQRALEAHRLGLEVERAMLSVIGTKRRRTYGHDMVYGLPGLYMMLGKPYLGACENNEHAHMEMKHFFRRMASKGSKTRSACLQVLDMMVAKRILVDEHKDLLPRTKYTTMRTGLTMESSYASRGVKCSDDTVEDSKENMKSLLPRGEALKADPMNLDPITRAKLEARA